MNSADIAAAEAAGEEDFKNAFQDAADAIDDAAGIKPDSGRDSPANVQDDERDSAPAFQADADEAPAHKADANDTPPAGAPASAVDIDALIAQADPVVRAAYMRLQHADQSNRSRVSAYQRKIDELTAKGKTANDKSNGSASADPFDTPEIREAMDSYGDVLSPVMGVIKAQQARLDGMEQTAAERAAAREAAEQLQASLVEENAVRAKHADYDAVINDQKFADWVAANPEFGPTIEANGAQIVNATAVNRLFDRFKRESGWGTPPPKQGNDPNSARRQRQIASSMTVPATAASNVTAKGSDDYEGAFAEAVQADDREQQNRRRR